MFNEKELIQLYLDVFKRLNVPVCIQINHRKILAGIAIYCQCEQQLTDMTVAIDKLDKIGVEKVKEELQKKGISIENVEKIFECILGPEVIPNQTIHREVSSFDTWRV